MASTLAATAGAGRGRRAPAGASSRIVRALAERRIPVPIVQAVSHVPGWAVIARGLQRVSPSAAAHARVTGMLPLPMRSVSYSAFEHRAFDTIAPSPDVPHGAESDAGWHRWTAAGLWHRIRSSHVVIVPGGFATAGGEVFSADGELIHGASVPARTNDQRYIVQTRILPRTWRGNRIAVLTSGLQDNYFHWLIETLPRLHMVRSQGLQPDAWYVPSGKPFQAETLRMLDVPERGCIDPLQFPVVHAREIVAPFHEIVGGMTHPAWVVRFLQEHLLPSRATSAGPAQPRLYITRAGARWRRVTNEDEVMRVLEPLGFHRLSLDHMTVADQMRLFHEAEVVVAPHGAALANLAFARPGTKVVEFQPRKIQDVFYRLCQAAGLEYRYLTSLTGPDNAANNQQQIDVDPRALAATLGALGVR